MGEPSPYETIRFEIDDGVAQLTIARPARLNALSPGTIEELRAALARVDEDHSIRCMIVTGEGDRAFSTGFDLDGLDWPTRTDEVERATKVNFETLLRIWDLRVPVIAAVNGYALAAGSNLALICDITIASERASFGEPEVRHFALSPMLLLPWLCANPKRANYLYFTGDTISADEALRLGLVAEVVPHEALMTRAWQIARRIATVPPFAIEMTKESVRRAYETMGFRTALTHHRALDALMLGASGIPERDRFFELLRSGDMKTFLAERDGPFRSIP